MARKKKTEDQIIDEVSKLVAEETLQATDTPKKKSKKKDIIEGEVKVVKGSHLTVTTYPDGRTELEWDDDALMRDVQEAIASYEATVKSIVGVTEEKVKKSRKQKVTE